MANYPSVRQTIGSVRESSSGTVVDRAVSGKPRFRSYFSKVWHVFKIEHDLITLSEWTSILDHYDAHQFSEFDFVFMGDSVTYKVRYADVPLAQPMEGNEYWKARTVLVATEIQPNVQIRITCASSVAATGVQA